MIALNSKNLFFPSQVQFQGCNHHIHCFFVFTKGHILMCGIEVFILKALQYFNSLVVNVEIKIRTGMQNLNSE